MISFYSEWNDLAVCPGRLFPYRGRKRVPDRVCRPAQRIGIKMAVTVGRLHVCMAEQTPKRS